MHNKETCDSDSCYRFFEDFDTTLCHYDTCWHELLYPMTRAYQPYPLAPANGYYGYGSEIYTRAVALVFLLFILGYLAITKPWR